MSLCADNAFARSLLLLVLFASPLSADIVLPRAGGPVTVDGDLSEPAWTAAAVIGQFYEYQRSDNGPSPVPTTAYVMYDDHYLYVGIDCRDPDPSKILGAGCWVLGERTNACCPSWLLTPDS